MSHARQLIRQAAVAAVTGLVSTGARVFQSRMRPQEDLPCLLVTTGDEDIVRADMDGAIEQREIEIEIVGVAMAATAIDDVLDTIAAEIETAIGASNTLGGHVQGMHLTHLRTEFDDELEQPGGEVRLTYRCTYFTHAGVPGTTL